MRTGESGTARSRYNAAYEDVAGLRPGSVVRMGGIDIGTVENVEHATKADDNKVYVTC